METERLKQGAAGDAPGGGRRRVRRFAPRLPVTCPDSNPRPISRRGTLFRSVSSFFLVSFFFCLFLSRAADHKILRHFRPAARRHNKWQYVKDVNTPRNERARDTLNDRALRKRK